MTVREGAIILGCPRSGTTLLRRLLSAHPRLHCPAETNVFTGMGRFMREERIVGELPVGPVSGLAMAGIAPEQTLRGLRELAFGWHRELASRAGKPRWAAKTAFDAFYLDELLELCQDQVSYICIVRHGLDVACSIQELCDRNGSYLRELHEYVQRWPSPREAFVHTWQDITEKLLQLAASRPEQAVLVRYEDLVSDPGREMGRIFEALAETSEGWSAETALGSKADLGLGDWKAQQRRTVEASSVGRWRALPPTEISRLAAVANPTLEKAGYPSIPTSPPPSAEEARRRYQLGLMLPSLPRAQK